MKIIQIPLAYSAAVLMAYLVGCLVISQGNIAAVTGMGFEITLSQRWQTAIHDIANMTNLYLPLIAVAYLIALPVTAGVIRVASAPRLLAMRTCLIVLRPSGPRWIRCAFVNDP